MTPDALLRLNLEVLSELRRQVVGTGARLIVVDLSGYLGRREHRVARALRRWAREQEAGYVPLDRDLLSANAAGRSTRWRYDGHFNEFANEIFASAMQRWFVEERARQAESGS